MGPGQGKNLTGKKKRVRNNVRVLREQNLLSKAELARKAGVSPLTIDRVEGGAECRLDTKRKIILALGKTIHERDDVFPDPSREEGEGAE
jgi:DNA-binding XRE family transcriptional regulator